MAIEADLTTGGDFSVLDIGKVKAALVEIVEAEGQFGPQWCWKFRTIEAKQDPDGGTVEPGLSLWGFTSRKYSDWPSRAYE